ncbi:hypothetical protein EMCRGX_G020925 [Ephydatia muelleri]
MWLAKQARDLTPKRACTSNPQEETGGEDVGGARGDKKHKNASCVVESPKDDDIIMSEVELDKDTFQKCSTTSFVGRPSGGVRALKHFYTGRSIVLHYVRREREREGREKGGKGNLWLFVSKFTPSQPQKLYKLYKKARKERGKEDMPVKRHYLESSEQGSSQHSCKHGVCGTNKKEASTIV